jgi:hypothetical protein
MMRRLARLIQSIDHQVLCTRRTQLAVLGVWILIGDPA